LVGRTHLADEPSFQRNYTYYLATGDFTTT
jgi:hypothetical protein